VKEIKHLLAVTGFITNHPLNARNRIAALAGFCRWQVGSRLLNKKVIVPWVGESRFIAGRGEAGLTGNIYGGFMEHEEMLFLLHALQQSETFVDVGANVGAYTILASKVVGARSIAFEPLPETADRLRDQIHVNRLEAVVDLRNKGVGARIGTLHFTNNNDTVNRVSLADDPTNTTRVDVSTLDDELAGGTQYFLKIDVEGFEYNVVEGASRILSSADVSAVIIELNGSGEEYGHSDVEVHRRLLSFGFMPVAYDPFCRELTRLSSFNENRDNTIYVREFETIAARCKAAPRRIVHTANGLAI
jgi:FkbM family methyltransferase